MAEYGITEQGLTIKRLPDVLSSKRQKAIALFQDKVQPGDTVDVSDSSLLGRLIGIDAESDAFIWEIVQEVYSAFDPNSATGAALDNMVALAALTRQDASASIAQLMLYGTVGTNIPSGATVSSITTNTEYETSQQLTLSPTRAAGIGVTVGSVQIETAYQITYQNGSFSYVVNYVSSATPSADEILYGIKSLIDSAHPALNASISGNILNIYKDELFELSDFVVTSNLFINKAANIVQAIAVEVGPVFNEANTIVQIRTPVLGWDTATNPIAATRGSNTETDEELRVRFRNSKAIRSTNIIESLYSSLYSIPEVSSVQVYENFTDIIDEFDVPPHAFKVVILGGDAQSIANAIWKNKPVGIRSAGTTVVTVLDSYNNPHEVAFVRPSPVPVYIDIQLETFAEFPPDGIERIKTELVNYFQENFGVGKEIILSRLYTPINNVPGHEVLSLNIGIDPSQMASENIQIPYDGISSLSTTNINIYT